MPEVATIVRTLTGTLLRDSLRRESRRPLCHLIVLLAVCAGVLVVAWPAGIDGDPLTLGLLGGAHAGSRAALASGPILAFLLAVTVTGSDDDTGLDREWHLVGVGRARRAMVSWIVAAVLLVTVDGLLITATALAGLADTLTRKALSSGYISAFPPVHVNTWSLAADAVGLTWGWALAVTTRSTRRALTATLVLAGTFVLGVFLPPGWWRDLLILHPFAGLWARSYHGASFALVLPLDRADSIASIVTWSALLVAAAATKLRIRAAARPQKGQHDPSRKPSGTREPRPLSASRTPRVDGPRQHQSEA